MNRIKSLAMLLLPDEEVARIIMRDALIAATAELRHALLALTILAVLAVLAVPVLAAWS